MAPSLPQVSRAGLSGVRVQADQAFDSKVPLGGVMRSRAACSACPIVLS